MVSTDDRGQPKFSAIPILCWLPRSRSSVAMDEARSAVKAGLALNPTFTVARARAFWKAMSDDRTFLAGIEHACEGMVNAGLPEQ